MGSIYYIECLKCTCGVQVGKHFGLVSDILTEDEMDKLYNGKNLGGVPGEHQGGKDDVTNSILDAIEGSDWFEYRAVTKKLLAKIRDGYAAKLNTEPQEEKSEWGFWNDAVTKHDFYKDVIGFIDEHKSHQVAWQDNGHFFGSRGLPTYHHPKHPKPEVNPSNTGDEDE